MAENSKIEWTHHTFNPWRGCTKVSAGCDHCYAERDSKRFPAIRGVWGKFGTRVIASDAMWNEPVKWSRKAAEAGERHRVFCASLADVFEGPETMPEESWESVSAARERLGTLIDDTPHLDWLLLTKRPQNVLKYGPLGYRWTMEGMPKNVWLGTSAEDQKTFDERWPLLAQIPAVVRWLSCEPLIGPIDFFYYGGDHGDPISFSQLRGTDATEPDIPGVDWVIVGGESGPGARPFDIAWAREIIYQCQAASVPCFVKQLGAVPMESEAAWRRRPHARLLNARNKDRAPADYVPLFYADRKGGDMAEWPKDLQVRDFPKCQLQR